MLLIIIVLTLALLVVTVQFFWKSRDGRYLQGINGPPPNIIFGNALDLRGGSSVFIETSHELIKKYGPIYKARSGPFSTVLVVSDVKFLQYILSSTKIITKAYQYDFLQKWLGTGLLTSTGMKWKVRRRTLTPSFHFSILHDFVEVFESVGDVFINKLDQHVGEPSFNICPLVSLCTLDIVCEASMGTSINALNNENSDYVESIKGMCRIFTERTFCITAPFQPWIHPFTPNYFKEKKYLKIIHDYTDRVIDNKIKCPVEISNDKKNLVGSKNRLVFLDLLLHSIIDGKPLSKMDIREEVDTFMFGGHDTIASGITFTLYCLSAYPEIQSKVFEEQKQIFGERRNRKVVPTDLADMKYLELVIKEVLRLYPPVPVIARQVTEEFEWAGTSFPKGLTVLMNIYETHRNPENFNDPEKFIPERFLGAEPTNSFGYIPFSAGPRNCIGQKFAMMEMKTTISKVIRHFELLPPTPQHKLQLAPEFILVSKNGVNISFKRRN